MDSHTLWIGYFLFFFAREALEFGECIEEDFFTQHVDMCTRNDAILDLIITDEPAIIHDLENLGTFSGSDHSALVWKLELKTFHDAVYRQLFDYSKADTESIKHELHEIDWNKLFCEHNAEQCWTVFKDILHITYIFFGRSESCCVNCVEFIAVFDGINEHFTKRTVATVYLVIVKLKDDTICTLTYELKIFRTRMVSERDRGL